MRLCGCTEKKNEVNEPSAEKLVPTADFRTTEFLSGV